ncbi:MAG: DUF1302 family protein [Rhodothermia bacterium]
MFCKRFVFFVTLALLPVAVWSQARLSGFVSIDKRFDVGTENVLVADFYNRFRSELSAPLGEKLFLFSSLDLRFYDLPRVSSVVDLEDIESLFPTDLSLWEAYAELTGFLFDDLDVRVGKQRIAWGRADRFNPTDNLNPDDFSDLIDFGAKIPTWAIKATYYLGDLELTGVWLPSVIPILLPRGGTSLFLGIESTTIRDTLIVPSAEIKNSMFAFKVGGVFEGWDYSLSYFNGFDDLPAVSKVVVGGNGRGPTPEYMELVFPRLEVLGADLATDLGGIGFWGEAGVFWQEEIITRTYDGTGYSASVTLDDRPYVKYTVGGDYTFPGGFYVNGQLVHGFFTERGAGNLRDYLFAQVEKDILQDELQLILGGAFEVGNRSNISDSYGLGFFPAVTYKAIDNLEATLGAFFVGGGPSSLFGAWDSADQVYLRLKVYF